MRNEELGMRDQELDMEEQMIYYAKDGMRFDDPHIWEMTGKRKKVDG